MSVQFTHPWVKQHVRKAPSKMIGPLPQNLFPNFLGIDGPSARHPQFRGLWYCDGAAHCNLAEKERKTTTCRAKTKAGPADFVCLLVRKGNISEIFKIFRFVIILAHYAPLV